MNKIFTSVLLLLFVFRLQAQSSPDKLDVVSWNIEWFGASFQNPADDNLQEANVKKVLRYLNADIYGLVEVVDTAHFRKLVDSLGSNWGYAISPFGSNNTTGTGNGWLTTQKLGFVYNKNIFSNVRTRGLMRTSSTAYTNFASGRFPFMLTADVTINGTTKTMNFILIHGKAGDTQSDYQRRKAATQELKDTLDAQFSNTINFILGDFNDALNTTICSGCGTSVSSYEPLIKDSVDADSYKSLTLPLGALGQSSMTDYPNVIDNHVISNELLPFYVPQSVKIRTDVTSLVGNYGNTTTDHYPVSSQYDLNGNTTGLPTVSASVLKLQAYPNPFGNRLMISFGRSLQSVKLQVRDMQGRLYYSQQLPYVAAGTVLQPSLPALANGIYFLSVQTRENSTVIKLEKKITD